MKRSLILALFSLILATACAPFPQNLMRDAQLAVSVSDVQKEPDRYRGEVVIWGGVVIDALNRRDETVLKVMQTDLDFQKRPTNTARSPGRFLVRCKGFLDPYIYSKGREITIAGVIIGKEEQNIGEILYAYPVLEAQEIRLWEERQDPQYWGPPYGWGYPYPWWPGYPYWW
ncbi:Slp family lipoprotein [Syntrophus buswellii]|uniref:Slp family lipoprotein n=1 Tax=Syntrophus TaxID=43773 RepID=UPI00345EC078